MTRTVLQDAFGHHVWATLRLIDACLALTPDQLEMTVPGTYGSILATMRVLALLKPLGLTQYGPEQVNFLRYRPVLDNRRLKEEFGYVPKKTSAEVFAFYLAARVRRAGA